MQLDVSDSCTTFVARLFGSFALFAPSGDEIDLANPQMRDLLAYHCLVPDVAQERDYLSRGLWPGRFPAQARASLRQCLYDLTRILNPHGACLLTGTRGAVTLRAAALRSDLSDILAALRDGTTEHAIVLLQAVDDRALLANIELAPERHAWLIRERDRAENALCSAIEVAATHGGSGGDTLRTIAARRREQHKARAEGLLSNAAPTRTSADRGDYSVAVLAFDFDPAEPRLAFVADEIGRELTERLSRAPHLHVAAFDAQGLRKSPPTDIATAARTLCVRYVANGTLHRCEGRCFVRVSLSNGQTGRHLWSKRIALPEPDPLSDLDLLSEISIAILCEMQICEATALSRVSDAALRDYEVVQKAEMLRRIYSRERALDIVRHLEDAISRHPDSATGHASLAIQTSQNVISGFSADIPGDVARAHEHAARSLALAPLDPEALAANGIVHAMFGECQRSVDYLRRAHERDPDNAHVLAMLGWQSSWLDSDERPIDLIRKAEASAPHHPRMANWANYRGVCLMKLARYDEAIGAFRECYERNTNWHFNLIIWASLASHLGDEDTARKLLDRALTIAPYFKRDHYPVAPCHFPAMWTPDYTMEQARQAVLRVWPEAAGAASNVSGTRKSRRHLSF